MIHQTASSPTADYLWWILPNEGVRLAIAYETHWGFSHENWLPEFTDARWIDSENRCVVLGENERDSWLDTAQNAYNRSEEFERDIRQACREHWQARQAWLRLGGSNCHEEAMPEERKSA